MDDARRIERFAERLDALGADFARWPAAEAGEAYGLIAHSPAARDLHAQALRLRELVVEAAQANVPNGFAFRVVADVAARRSDRLGWLLGSPGRLGFAGAAICAAALALGVALGAVSDRAEAGGSDLGLGSAFSLSIADGDF